jgi:hypothetical protein
MLYESIFEPRTAPPAASAQGRLRVNRVDFATSALASAIHNTGHLRPIGTGLPVALPRPNCKRPAQPRQLRRSALDRLRDMSCTCGRQRPGISTAPNPRGGCSRHACPGFCPMAVWRTIAQDRRRAKHRPLDSRIKHPRCAAAGRVTAQRLIAIFLASPHIARIRLLLCAQEVSAMCGRGRSNLALLSALLDQPTPVKARAFRAPGSAG